MSTYRERREARADRLDEWADKRADKAAALVARDETLWSDWAFVTQPGHIPERARAIARMERVHENETKARAMTSRAAEIRRQADRSIYSDDPDACERLAERIAELEAEREACKTANAAYRKEHRAELAAMTAYGRNQAVPFPSYHLENLSGSLSRQRQRLAQLQRQAAAPAGTVSRRVYNRRPGPCEVCGETVDAGYGCAEKIDGDWSVRHWTCER